MSVYRSTMLPISTFNKPIRAYRQSILSKNNVAHIVSRSNSPGEDDEVDIVTMRVIGKNTLHISILLQNTEVDTVPGLRGKSGFSQGSGWTWQGPASAREA
jgi:hypothetical protein